MRFAAASAPGLDSGRSTGYIRKREERNELGGTSPYPLTSGGDAAKFLFLAVVTTRCPVRLVA
jgi:hypothetical protein